MNDGPLKVLASIPNWAKGGQLECDNFDLAGRPTHSKFQDFPRIDSEVNLNRVRASQTYRLLIFSWG